MNPDRTNADISSLKFAEFLKKNLPGTYQEFFGDYFLIYPEADRVELIHSALKESTVDRIYKC